MTRKTFILVFFGVVAAVTLVLSFYRKLWSFPSHSYLASCLLPQTAKSEWGERDVAYKYTDPDACVLEFGGGSGSVSSVIQERLRNPSLHTVVQPVRGMMGGVSLLRKNKTKCGYSFTIIPHILKKGELNDPPAWRKAKLPCLHTLIVADCEGCLKGEYTKNPRLFDRVEMIQVERDDFRGEYDSLLKDTLGMKMVHQGPHFVLPHGVQVWERDLPK